MLSINPYCNFHVEKGENKVIFFNSITNKLIYIKAKPDTFNKLKEGITYDDLKEIMDKDVIDTLVKYGMLL